MAKRPNFLFVITDEQRADYLGCAGHPVLKTPNIDRIAARGARFTRFYVAIPICTPNRATLVTGRMPSLTGVRHNGIALPHGANTFVDLLRANGYRTALIGKSDLQPFLGEPPGVRREPPRPGHNAPPMPEFAEAMKPRNDGRYDQELPTSWGPDPNYRLDTPFYGFEHVDLCTMHGDDVGAHYRHWLRRQRPDADSLIGPDNALPHDYTAPQAWRTAVPEELYPTSYIADRAIEWLDGHGRGDDPFFLMCAIPDPHHPFTPPGKYWDMYKPEDMVLPPSFRQANVREPHIAWLHEQLARGIAIRHTPSPYAVTEREARETIALTCGMIAMIDDAVGRIVAKLAAIGRDRDTVVVFTADHGDYMGDHGLMLKGPIHLQSLIRVPFLWADPEARPLVTDALSGTLDIATTILDRARIQPYNGIQGRSLLSVMRGEADAAHEAILIEEDGQRVYMGFRGPIRCRTLVTRRWRTTIYHGVEWGELYDLDEDPDELRNLWDDPHHAAVRSHLMELMARKQMELVDRSPLPTAMA
ncbi:MAG TPA: sulfatase-like hydrolase/transferase [Alphaproteobacteria bacterium]